MKILFPSGQWCGNIGNGFFDLGIQHMLEKVAPSATLVPIDVGPKINFMPGRRLEARALPYHEHVGGADVLMLAGPMFSARIEETFGPALREARRNGMQLWFLSAGGNAYDEAETEACRRILRELEPEVLFSRDRQTFDAYGDLFRTAYDGICFAFSAGRYYDGYAPDERPYLTFTFDSSLEPTARWTGDGPVESELAIVRPPVFGRGGKVRRLVAHKPAEVGSHPIVRPTHSCRQRHNARIYVGPNSFASESPYPYLNLYRNTTATLTDRLHAAVATLAFGNPARLWLASGRTRLLERVGLDASGWMTLRDEVIQPQLDDLQAALGGLFTDHVRER